MALLEQCRETGKRGEDQERACSKEPWAGFEPMAAALGTIAPIYGSPV